MMEKLRSFLQKPFHNKLNALYQAWREIFSALYYRSVFGSFGSGSILYSPMLISNPQCMHIGKNVLIRSGVRLEAVILDPKNPPELYIGNNVNIEQDVHIVVIGKIAIGNNVSITARSSLLCGTHPFLDVDSPVKIGNRVSGIGSVIEIGEGSFLGVGCVLQMNSRLGKHVVVGSNSVVKGRFPDYSVIDGNPAVSVMSYLPEEGMWKPTLKG